MLGTDVLSIQSGEMLNSMRQPGELTQTMYKLPLNSGHKVTGGENSTLLQEDMQSMYLNKHEDKILRDETTKVSQNDELSFFY